MDNFEEAARHNRANRRARHDARRQPRSQQNRIHRQQRNTQSQQNRIQRQQRNSQQHRRARAQESPQQRHLRQQQDAEQHRTAYAHLSPQQRDLRQEQNTEQHRTARAQESPQQRQQRQQQDAQQHFIASHNNPPLYRVAFQAISDDSVQTHSCGTRTFVCPHCHALLWPAEKSRTTMCCCSGKNLNLQSIFSTAFPPLLHDLFTWDVTTNQTSPTNLTPRVIRNFRKHIRQYNCALQMASSGMKIAAPNQGISMIVAKGSVYHLMGPLIPNQGVPQFAQLYIIDNDSEQVHQRLRNFVNNNMNRELLQRLQECLLQCNPFVQQF